MKHLLLFCLFFCAPILIFSQGQNGFNFGLRAGWAKSKVDGLSDNIIPSFYNIDTNPKFSTKEYTLNGLVGGLQFSYKWDLVSLLAETGFARRGGVLKYNQIEPDSLSYNMSFKYNYFDLALVGKWYITKILIDEDGSRGGLNLQGGLMYGFNLPSDNNIEYESMPNDDEIEDLVARNLNATLKGKGIFAALIGIGFDIPLNSSNHTHALSFDFRYRLGFNDLIKTKKNDFLISSGDNYARRFDSNFEITAAFIFGTSY